MPSQAWSLISFLINRMGKADKSISNEDELNLVKNRLIPKTEEERIKETEQLHKKLLNSLGIKYLGISYPHSKKKERATHCDSCKKELNNIIDIECNACGWIICNCGACGCEVENPKT